MYLLLLLILYNCFNKNFFFVISIILFLYVSIIKIFINYCAVILVYRSSSSKAINYIGYLISPDRGLVSIILIYKKMNTIQLFLLLCDIITILRFPIIVLK